MVNSRLSTIVTLIVLGLAIFGLVMVGDASVVSAARDFGNKWHYFQLQSMWLIVSIISFIFFVKFPHQILEKYAKPMMLITIGLLVLVLIPGIGSKVLGARRWLGVGQFYLQPAELAKITISIYLANILARPDKYLPIFFVIFTIGGLILLEPDMGTALTIMAFSFLTYFSSGGKIRYLFMMTPLVAIAMVILVVVAPYRLNRLKTFLDISHDPSGASYQVRQALIGLGSGGVFGVGFGQSRQKYDFLPEVTTDSIFAVVGEELGLLGTIFLISCFLCLCLTGFSIVQSLPNGFSSRLALAISCWFGIQSFINISANVALVPFTGIPLPLISYGGSALLFTLTASGILVNIASSHTVKHTR